METFKSFDTEEEAREFARTNKPSRAVSIVHSPHKNNSAGDYFVDWGMTIGFTRSWEKLLFTGKGAKA